MTFNKDLQFGNKYEKEFLNHINYDSFKISEGNFKPYDLLVTNNGKTKKVEVKADRLLKKTGNICIEIECNNKLSGISTTESDYYGYFEVLNDDTNSYNLYIIPTIKIKELIKNKKYHRTIQGGDRKASKFHLFNKSHFEDFLI